MKLALLSADHRLAVLGGLVHELKEMLLEDFTTSRVEHVPRECTQVAHELAKLGASYQLGHDYVAYDVTGCIMGLVANDLAGSLV